MKMKIYEYLIPMYFAFTFFSSFFESEYIREKMFESNLLEIPTYKYSTNI